MAFNFPMRSDSGPGSSPRTGTKRDPRGTRERILEAAREILAQDGKEGMSVAQVARRAGVNRGTPYHHFRTREALIDATAAWVSEKLYRAAFGDPEVARRQPVETIDTQALTEHIVEFAMENPELGRAWLIELLSSQKAASDKFWLQYVSNFQKFADTGLAQPGIDVEVVSIIMLAAMFLWPVWVRTLAGTAEERHHMAKRLSREILRFSLHGAMRPEKHPELDALLGRGSPEPC